VSILALAPSFLAASVFPVAAQGLAGEELQSRPQPVVNPSDPLQPEATYWVYAGAESADLLHRIRFGPGGAHLEESISVASLYHQSSVPELFTESEAPHGVAVDPERDVVYMTTGHGLPDGKLWKIEAGTGRLLADPVELGRFPASLGLSPEGDWVFVANFNLHGQMRPSTVSVVHGGQMMELARIETCTMPHGSRVHPMGRYHYSVCMMDDQLVEIDGWDLAVNRRMLLKPGGIRSLAATDLGFHDPERAQETHAGHGAEPAGFEHEPWCSPTWVQPSPEGERIYVACNGSDQVLEIAWEEWDLLRRFQTGRGPYNLDVTADGRLLVITLKQGDGVEFIDLNSGSTVARLATSTRVVHGVALSPDSRYAFVSVEGIGEEPGRVDIFDLEEFTRVDSVPVGQQASGIAFWRMQVH